MLERVREYVSSLFGSDDSGRYVSRAEREDRQRRILLIAAGVVAVGVIVSLAIGAFWQYVLVPRETYATVNGEDIRRVDYDKLRRYNILQELTNLSQQLQNASEDQQAGIQQQISVLQFELEDLEEGEQNLNPEALESMIQDVLVIQGLEDMGVELTDDEVDLYVDDLLSPVPLTDPTATFTVPPTAAAWATETVDAFLDQSTATAQAVATDTLLTATAESEAEGTAEEDGTASPEGTSEPTPDLFATSEAAATQTASAPTATPDPNATPDPDATPTFTPVPTIEPSATPNRQEALSTSEAGFDLLDRNFLDRAGMSRGDFKRLVARPQLARIKLNDILIQDIPTTQEQVRASHILVATRDAALELIDTRLQTEEFEVVAEEVSTDTSSAVNGGDLGWFTRGIMTPPFEEAAFTMEVGEISEPVQSEFGWHIINVTDRDDDRPLTVNTLRSAQLNAVNRWIEEEQANADIDAKVPLPQDNQGPSLIGN